MKSIKKHSMKVGYFGIIGSALLALPQVVTAQSQPSGASVRLEQVSDRPGGLDNFIVVDESKIVFVNGDWQHISQLRQYAGQHPGTYVLYERNGDLHKIADQEAVRNLRPHFATATELGANQNSLRSRQEPLGKQQSELAKKAEESTTPAERTEINKRRSQVGQLQGEIGREQARVGQQQSIAGVRAYKETQKIIDLCEKDATCSTTKLPE